MRQVNRCALILLLATSLLLLPIHSLAASRALPIEGDYTLSISGDGQVAYVAAMNGGLFRYNEGDSQVEPLTLTNPIDWSKDTLLDMCVIDGGIYYALYDSNVLRLVYAEKAGLPETITIPVQSVKGGHSGSDIKHMVYDGAALWLMMDARNNDKYILCRFDLKQNTMKAYDNSLGLYGFVLLPEGRVALGFNMYEKEKVFGRLSILDMATGKTSQQADIPERPEAMAFDKSRNAVLYISQSKLWAWSLSGQPKALRNMPVNGNGWSNAGIIMDGGLLSVHAHGLFLADPEAESGGKLHIIGESPGFGYAGIYDTYMSLRPDVDLSFQSQVSQNETVNTGELGQRIKTGMLPFDVMLLSTQEHNLHALISKGYCLDMSGDAELMAAVQTMHPAIRNVVMKDGKLYAFPLRVDGIDVLRYYAQYLPEAGLTPADLPQSFESLVQMAGAWPQSLQDDMKPLMVTEMAPALKQYFMSRFMDYSYRQHGRLDFMDPLFLSMLNLIESQRMPTYQEQMPSVMWTGGGELMKEDVLVLPLTDGGPRLQSARLYLYFINSQTENPDLALDYVRTALHHQKPEHKATLYQTWTAAVEQDDYADWLAKNAKEESLLREAVSAEDTDTPAGRAAQERLDAHLAQVEQRRASRQYKVSPSELAFYQQEVAPYLFFPPVNPFTSYNEPGGEAIYNEIHRFTQGQQSAQAFAQSMDQKARLMELEGEE